MPNIKIATKYAAKLRGKMRRDYFYMMLIWIKNFSRLKTDLYAKFEFRFGNAHLVLVL